MDLVDGGRFTRVELTGHAAIQNRERTCANILRQLEILVKAQAERLIVVRRRLVVELVIPAINDGLAFGDVADCGFPAVTGSQTTSFHNAAAWEAKKPGVHVSKKLGQVLPKSVRPVLPGIEREQGNHVEIDRALLVKKQIDLCVLLGSAGADHGFILLPDVSK